MYYVVARGSFLKRQYLRFGIVDRVYWANSPFHSATFATKESAEEEAKLHDGARVIRRGFTAAE